MKKQFIAKLLVLGLILAMLPTAAFAATAIAEGTSVVYYYVTEDTNSSVGNTTTPSAPEAEDITALPDEPTTEITEITVEDGTAVLEVEVVDGVAYATVTEEALDVEVEGDTLTLVVEADGADKVYVDLPGAALVKLGKDVTVESDVASITIPSDAGTGALKDAKTVTVAAAVSDNGAFTIAVMADGNAVTKSIKGLVVKF